jgi:hypothetical protein
VAAEALARVQTKRTPAGCPSKPLPCLRKEAEGNADKPAMER